MITGGVRGGRWCWGGGRGKGVVVWVGFIYSEVVLCVSDAGASSLKCFGTPTTSLVST